MDAYGWSLELFTIARIRVKIHWILLLWWGFDLNQRLGEAQHEGGQRLIFLLWLAYTGGLFLSIFLHELGHAFAARKMGGECREVILWPLGGLAPCQVPENWRAHLVVAAGGPLVTLAILAVSWLVFDVVLGAPPENLTPTQLLLWGVSRDVLVDQQIFLLVLNLLPLYPLDGGRIFHALAWAAYARWTGWNGYGLATRLTYKVSLVTGICGIIYALTNDQQSLALLFVWAILGASSLRERSW